MRRWRDKTGYFEPFQRFFSLKEISFNEKFSFNGVEFLPSLNVVTQRMEVIRANRQLRKINVSVTRDAWGLAREYGTFVPLYLRVHIVSVPRYVPKISQVPFCCTTIAHPHLLSTPTIPPVLLYKSPINFSYCVTCTGSQHNIAII